MKTNTTLESHKYKRPSDYIGATWYGYYDIVGRSRDSDALEESNFRVALKMLGGEQPAIDNPKGTPGEDDEFIYPVTVVKENHWAVGWIEVVRVHESNIKALEIASELLESIENYPVLDEEDFSEEERDRAELGVKNCYGLSEDEADKVLNYLYENYDNEPDGEDFTCAAVEDAMRELGIEV